MRTTLTLDQDVAAMLSEQARTKGFSLSRAANELLRIGLRHNQRVEQGRYDPPTFDSGRPLLDVTDVASALELLDHGE